MGAESAKRIAVSKETRRELRIRKAAYDFSTYDKLLRELIEGYQRGDHD